MYPFLPNFQKTTFDEKQKIFPLFLILEKINNAVLIGGRRAKKAKDLQGKVDQLKGEAATMRRKTQDVENQKVNKKRFT